MTNLHVGEKMLMKEFTCAHKKVDRKLNELYWEIDDMLDNESICAYLQERKMYNDLYSIKKEIYELWKDICYDLE